MKKSDGTVIDAILKSAKSRYRKGIIGIVAIVIAVVAAVLFGAPALFKLIWNWSVVSWLDVPTITYWQAFGVCVLWWLMWAGIFKAGGKK